MKCYAAQILAGFFALLLIGFAGLQINDPDPIIWTAFYGICAVVPLLLVFKLYYRSVYWVSILLCFAQLIIAAPGMWEYLQHMQVEPLMQTMDQAKPYIEEAREFLGSSIALCLMGTSRLMAGVLQKQSSTTI